MTQWSKKRCIRLMRLTIIRKASQDEQQNQTKTTNFNNIQNLCPLFFLKKISTKVKITSGKNEGKKQPVLHQKIYGTTPY